MKYNILWIAFLILACTAFVSCGEDEDETPSSKISASEKGTFTDNRDGSTYNWVRYGNLEWMSENFRYNLNDAAICRLYKDASGKEVNVNKYGRLYTYSGATKACPNGWRLPTDADWQKLEQTMGMSVQESNSYDWRGDIARRMLTLYGDTCDLNLQLSGYYTTHTIMGTTGYRFLAVYGYYWTATQDSDKGLGYYFFRKFIYNKNEINRQSMETEGNMLSVRYVRDV